MLKTARRDRTATARLVTACAQRLADERGLDGFTMDELAVAAGVSRRTLFNYFPTKVDAVLGEWPVLDDDDADDFRAGGPTGDLVEDLRALVMPLLETEVVDREVIATGRRVLISNPRLMGSVHARYEAISTDVVDHVVAREGAAFGKARAKVAVTLLAAVFDSALQQWLDDTRERSITFHFDEALRTARSLFGA